MRGVPDKAAAPGQLGGGPPAPAPWPRATLRRGVPAVVAGLLTVACIVLAAFWDYYPPLESTQRLTIFFDAPAPGKAEPLVVTGEPSSGDFLFVRYIDTQTIAIGYDKWGSGGPISKPVRIAAGQPHVLEIEMPSLQFVRGNRLMPRHRLRVAFDGEQLIDVAAEPNLRRPMRLWFGRNPIGGSSCETEFHGRIVRADGRALAGPVRTNLTRLERLQGWLRYARAQWIFALLAGVAVALAWWRGRRLGWADVSAAGRIVGTTLSVHRVFALTALVCLAGFALLVTGGTGRLLFPDAFADFYDYQALSLLDGRLDVPEGAISGEAFIFEGKAYGYFGLTPALLRLPFAIFNVRFGELTRVALLLYHAACLLAAYLLLCDATRLVAPATPRPSRWLTIVLTLNVGLGSTLLFLGSRAYVYHEAILCGVAFSLWGCWCAFRQLERPRSRWWLGALGCGILAINARPPSGLYALTLLGCVAVLLAWRERSTPHLIPFRILIGALAVAGALTFNAVGYLKFRTFNGWPLRLSVQYDAKRIARFEGKQFHVSNVPFTSYTYVWGPNVKLLPGFPWLVLNSSPPEPAFASAKMDNCEDTLAFVYTMTGLCVLAAAGAGLVRARRALAPRVVLSWVAGIPMGIVMLTAVVTAHRYTADFCPFLVCAAAPGAVAISMVSRRWGRLLAVVLATVTLWSIVITTTITLHFQSAMVWGAPDGLSERYQRLQATIDGWLGAGAER